MSSSRSQLIFIGVVLLVAAMMGLFAVSLATSQSDARTDLEERFAERPQVSAALTEALFASTTGTQAEENAELYGGAEVSAATMDEQSAQANNAFQVLVGEDGKLIAKSSKTPQAVLAMIEAGTLGIEAIYEGAPYGLSDVIELPDAESTIAFAIGVIGPLDRRVLVSGVSTDLLATFLGGYLGEVPNAEGGHAYVVDSNDIVIASQRGAIDSGAVVDEPGLEEALREGRTTGSFGPEGRYFAADPVADSTWTVVSTAPESALFETVEGASKWVPWILFVAFSVALVAVLLLIRRTLETGAQLAATNETLASARDQLQASNDALERRASELARSNAELDQFASIASHDLQEPLRKVQAFSSQVISSEDRLSDKGRAYLGRASSAAERMQELIQDLLKFSRVATDTRPFVETDLNEVAAEVLSDLETVVAETGATVEIGELPRVAVDPFQIRQLMQNLLSNALKFRREGVEHSVEVSGSTGERFVELVVRDNGIGFEPEYSDRIFRVFERLHGRGAYPGTGIGLALCRKIAERHGGTVGAEGAPGEGARFTVRLPLGHESAAQPRAAGHAAMEEARDE